MPLQRLLDLALVPAAYVLLLLAPGLAIAALLRLRRALPDVVVLASAPVLGLIPVAVVTAIHLMAGLGGEVAFALHAVIVAALVAAAIVPALRHGRGRGWRAAIRPSDASSAIAAGTLLTAVACAAVAAAVRGRLAFDTLYHAAVSRKLIELDDPSFSNINRFADGGPNPAYFLPLWQELAGFAARLTGRDVLVVWEFLPVITVVMGALAAAALAHVLLGRRAEVLGALAFLAMRVAFPRRTIDGDAVTFGNLPGFVVFDTVLPVLVAFVAVGIWHADVQVRRRALVVAATSMVLLTLLHANYAVYVALIGVGGIAWWLLVGPKEGSMRRYLAAAGVVAMAGAAVLAVLLPVLATLRHFGNPSEEERLSYHLSGRDPFEHIQGGHLYETHGFVGMLTLLVGVPLAAALWRTRAGSLAWGGGLALLVVALVPPLLALLSATGSLTLGLRLNHALWPTFVAGFAGGVLVLATRGRQWWSAPSRRVARRAAMVGVVVAFAALSVVWRYTFFGPDSPGYVGALALLGVAAWLGIRRRRDGNVAVEASAVAQADRAGPSRRALLTTCAILLVVAAPAGARSLLQVRTDARDWRPSVRADDLRCFAGPVNDALRSMPPGTTLLSDPMTSLDAMALAPVYVVGDYKVWNAETTDNRTRERLRQVNMFFDAGVDDASRLAILDVANVDYVLINPVVVEVPDVDEVLEQGYDGENAARLLESTDAAVGSADRRFTLVAAGDRTDPCAKLQLYRVRGDR